jgi:hypothetical protein
MKGHHALALSLFVLATCGGGSKKKPVQPEPEQASKKPAVREDTEQDREKARHDARVAIVPEGSSCLPSSLKADNAPRLELAGEGADAVLCAVDTDPARLLGPVGCWKIDLKNIDAKTNAPGLVYQDPAPLPGHDVDVLVTKSCARAYCLPDGKHFDGDVAHMSWSLDGTKVAVLAGSDVHVFDASGKAYQTSFPVGGDKGVTGKPVAVYFAGDLIFVEGRGDGLDAVWGFKPDGTGAGPINALGGKGEKPVSIEKGSFSILDPNRVALADHGMETLTTYEVATGKRTKSVRKLGKLACKPAEIDAYWNGGDKVTDKCRDSLGKSSDHLIGASAVMGKSNLLVVFHGDRLGELGVLEPKSLTESKKSFHLPWCDASGASAAAVATPPTAHDSDKKDEEVAPKTRGAVNKKSGDPEEGGARTTKSSDPEEGGQ